MTSLRIIIIQTVLLLGWIPLAEAQLVSREQVQSAKIKAILWSLFAAVMLGICIYKLVRYFKKKN